ncbi:hypothetical protein K239x_09640 [Planctomycetes bacterium K23_9]|uniref:Uncharacterized protein n=1 Tax=Stieleria marina TaxID=1930275 RepID=A0A517NPG8_9BACT|nr:hypothetical protein K239x_09640 [Planctomycetes bacterium K23_9]
MDASIQSQRGIRHANWGESLTPIILHLLPAQANVSSSASGLLEEPQGHDGAAFFNTVSVRWVVPGKSMSHFNER